MLSADWWAYSLRSTIPNDPCGVSSPLAAAAACPVSGVQPGPCYTGALGVLKSGILSPIQAKTLLALAKCQRKWKFAPAVAANQRKREAVEGFIARNNAARSFCGSSSIPWAIACGMRRLLAEWLPEIPDAAEGRFGPGACAEKWSHCYRFTRLAQWVSASTHWPEVPIGHSDMSAHVSRLCAVPKQYDKDRLITVEPAYLTFAQQHVRQLLLASIHAGPLRGTCMDLGWTDGQSIQRRLALSASRRKHLATLDLKDASDNITWADVKDVFPRWVVSLLEVTRSDSFTARVSREAEEVSYPLAIYAGMGNATTFVVETLFFSAYVKAFAWTRGLRTKVSTFGDDVICDSDVAALLLDEGQSPCFVVNSDKSFLGTDALRESCGIFAYNGVDITVPRIDGYGDSPPEREGLAATHRDLCRDPFFWGLAHAVCRDAGYVVWNRWIEGYPSLVDPYCCYSFHAEELEQSVRRNSGTQNLEVQVEWYEPRLSLIRCTDAPNDWTTRGLLLACLLGQARTVRRHDHSYVSFGDLRKACEGLSLRRRRRWHRVLTQLPSSSDDFALVRKAF